MNLIKSLRKISTENEFKNQLQNLIFKEAKNKEEVNNYPYIKISKSVASIKNYEFYDCSSLKYIIIPNSAKSIGNYAFAHCKSLTSITIPKKFENKMEKIFYNLDLSKVEVIYT